MNHPYTSLHMETRQAKQRLAQIFQDRHTESLFLPDNEDAPAENQQEAATDRPSMPLKVARQRKVLCDLRENAGSPKGPNETRRDMSAFSFTLTLLLSGTIAAANTDQPLFWLLIGPAPLAVDLAVTIFLRQRFHLDACLLALRKWNVQTENRDRAIGEVSLGCTCRLSR
jgi:hypothetical protein